jgi:hypothetical protein
MQETPMKRIATLVAFALLAACQTAPVDFEDSPSAVIPAASRLVLRQDIDVPAGRASLFIQDGRVVSYSEINLYRAHCRLEVTHVKDAAQTVAAGEFAIERVLYTDRPLPGTAAVLFASRAGGGIRVGDGVGPYVFATHMILRSARHPEVRELTCRRWDDPALGVHLTIREIRQTLGEIFTLELAR